MVDSSIKDNLTAIGFTEKEVKVYLALSTFGRLSISEIARRTATPRTSLYPLLAKMQSKGYLTRSKLARDVLWSAVAAPDLSQKFEESLQEFKDSVPFIEALLMPTDVRLGKTGVDVSTSRAGLINAYKLLHSAKESERIYFIQGTEAVRSHAKRRSDSIVEWQENFKKSKAIMEGIFSAEAVAIVRKLSEEARTAHHGRLTILYQLPDELMTFKSDIVIFRDTMLILVPQRDLVFTLTSPEVAETMKKIFEALTMLGTKINFDREIEG